MSTGEEAAVSRLSENVQLAWSDTRILDALFAEDGTPVKGSSPMSYVLRRTASHLVVRTKFHKAPVLWIREGQAYAAAAKKDGTWSPLQEGRTPNELLNKKILPFVNATARTQFSANRFFLIGTALPKPVAEKARQCFECASCDPRPGWRYGDGLQALCSPCWKKQWYSARKRQLEETTEHESEGESADERGSDGSDETDRGSSNNGEDEYDMDLWTSTPAHFYIGILLSGTTWNKAAHLLLIAGIRVPGYKAEFHRFHNEQVAPAIAILRNQLFDAELRRAAKETPIVVSMDCGWSTRRNALEGIVSCFLHRSPHDVVLLECQLVVQDRDPKAAQISEAPGDKRVMRFVGASTSYESYGIEAIAARLRASNVDVSHIIKDGDSNSLVAMKKWFPNVKAVYDINHFLKKIPDNVAAASHKHKELRGLCRVQDFRLL